MLGTIHVTQNFLGVFQGAKIKSGPKAPTDLMRPWLQEWCATGFHANHWWKSPSMVGTSPIGRDGWQKSCCQLIVKRHKRLQDIQEVDARFP